MSNKAEQADTKLRVVVTVRADVCPELWAALANISPYGRSERLRTLATAALCGISGSREHEAVTAKLTHASNAASQIDDTFSNLGEDELRGADNQLTVPGKW